jgi:hypothetical protein
MLLRTSASWLVVTGVWDVPCAVFEAACESGARGVVVHARRR